MRSVVEGAQRAIMPVSCARDEPVRSARTARRAFDGAAGEFTIGSWSATLPKHALE
jgi:hypothetical protein